jgi:hypothetical protein
LQADDAVLRHGELVRGTLSQLDTLVRGHGARHAKRQRPAARRVAVPPLPLEASRAAEHIPLLLLPVDELVLNRPVLHRVVEGAALGEELPRLSLFVGSPRRLVVKSRASALT